MKLDSPAARCATIILFLTPCLASASPARGGGPDSIQEALCSLSLRTGTDTAWVFIDSACAGKTPLTVDSLRGGRHLLKLVQTDLGSWLTGSISDTVSLSPGEQRTLRYTFERRVIVVTDPSGAFVYMGDSIAGITPCVLVSRSGELPSSITVERRGYEKKVLLLPPGNQGITRSELKKIWQSEASETSLMTESGSSARTGVRLYVAGGVTVAAGVAAAYFKIRADGQNGLYLDTGEPAYQRETRRLDTAAAIALFVTEAGFAFFSYLLLTD